MGGGSTGTGLALVATWPERWVEGPLVLQQCKWSVSGFGAGEGRTGSGQAVRLSGSWTPMLGWTTRHRVAPVFASKIPSGDSSRPIAGGRAFPRRRKRMSPSPEETPVAAVVPDWAAQDWAISLVPPYPYESQRTFPLHFSIESLTNKDDRLTFRFSSNDSYENSSCSKILLLG